MWKLYTHMKLLTTPFLSVEIFQHFIGLTKLVETIALNEVIPMAIKVSILFVWVDVDSQIMYKLLTSISWYKNDIQSFVNDLLVKLEKLKFICLNTMSSNSWACYPCSTFYTIKINVVITNYWNSIPLLYFLFWVFISWSRKRKKKSSNGLKD